MANFLSRQFYLSLRYNNDFGKKKPLCYNLGVDPAQGTKGGKPSPSKGDGISILELERSNESYAASIDEESHVISLSYAINSFFKSTYIINSHLISIYA